jgi:hypothetical protein
LPSVVNRSGAPGLLENLPKHLDSCLSPSLEKSDAVAIKLHMGEEGNARYIRPGVVRCIADWLKSKRVEPFVTDSTTLYRRKRGTLFDYLRTAAKHGFTSETMGCPVLIADGLKSSGVVVEVENPVKMNEVGVSYLIHEADVLISLSHVTLHPDVVPAAGLKNVAMGCTNKEAKMRMHASDAKPKFSSEKCTGCGTCVRHCPADAIELVEGKARFDPDKCVSCAECIAFCDFGAITVNWSALSRDVCNGVVDAARAVLSTFEPGKSMFMNLGYDITEECDCGGGSNLPVVTDFGVLSGTDPVAVDTATAHLLNEQDVYPGGPLEKFRGLKDRISAIKPEVRWEPFLELAEARGLGSRDYEFSWI